MAANVVSWRTLLGQGARILTLLLYAGIIVLALAPSLVSQLSIAPLIVEGIQVSLQVVLGVSLAWVYFVEPAQQSS